MRRIIRTTAAALIAAGTLAATSATADARPYVPTPSGDTGQTMAGDVGPAVGGAVITTRIPQYRLEARSFTAVDESGWDWTGSDEPVLVFSWSDGTQIHTWESPKFDDVDSGETFSLGNQCLLPPALCATGAPAPMWMTVQVHEIDGGYTYGELSQTTKDAIIYGAAAAGYGLGALLGDPSTGATVGKYVAGYLLRLFGDDVIGSINLTYNEWDFTSVLPNVGSTYSESVMISGYGGDFPEFVDDPADYSIRIRARRMPDKVVYTLPDSGQFPVFELAPTAGQLPVIERTPTR
jgi:hypothetical protein